MQESPNPNHLKHVDEFNFDQNLFTANFSINLKTTQKVLKRQVFSVTLSQDQITWNLSAMSDLRGFPLKNKI